MTEGSRFVSLNVYVAGGALEPENFSIATRTLPKPGDGEVLLETLALSVDPYMRGRMTGIDTFYLPQFALGKPITSLGIGRVLESRREGVTCGDVVHGLMEWGDHSIWSGVDNLEDGGMLRPVDPAWGKPSYALGVFGLNGLTALFGIVGPARVKEGDIVLISAAAGGIGSLAGQIARILGARVIGLASSEEKRRVLTEDLGFDAALDYRSASLEDDLRAVMPHGPDIYFDNVGGQVTQTVMRTMRRQARIVECGQISTYDDDDGGWTVDIRPIHANGLIWEGYNVANFREFLPGGLAQLSHWVKVGKLKALETEHHGLESAPNAMVGILRGGNIGKMVVILRDQT